MGEEDLLELQDLLFELLHASLLVLQLITEAAQLPVVDLPVVLHLFLQGSLWSRSAGEVWLDQLTSPPTFISAASSRRFLCSFSLSITSSSCI